MKLANTAEMREIDKRTIEEVGISGLVLMENVGAEIARCALRQNKQSYCVVCGKGNNGGDGFVAARWLYNAKKDVTVVLLCDESELKNEAKTNFEILKRMNIKISGLSEDEIKKADVVIDALCGTGVLGALKGKVKDAVVLINKYSKFVISADLPSGVTADSGEVYGECVKADITVTAGVSKIGLCCYPSAEYAGEVIVCEASFPERVIEQVRISTETIETTALTERKQNSHKGSFGKILSVCGSKKYAGAAVLAATSALKSGAGIVTAVVPDEMCSIERIPELIVLPQKSKDGMISSEEVSEILENIRKSDAVILGCGLGLSAETEKLVEKIIAECEVPLVIDADGLNSICKNTDILKQRKCDIILTPHIGEFSRLTGLDSEYITNNTVSVAKVFAAEYNVVLVLKCARTVVANPDGKALVCTLGNSGMATAGSGDVLSGIIGSFSGQKLSAFDAAVAGVYVHAVAGDMAKGKYGEYGMTAGNILENIPYAIEKVKKPKGN